MGTKDKQQELTTTWATMVEKHEKHHHHHHHDKEHLTTESTLPPKQAVLNPTTTNPIAPAHLTTTTGKPIHTTGTNAVPPLEATINQPIRGNQTGLIYSTTGAMPTSSVIGAPPTSTTSATGPHVKSVYVDDKGAEHHGLGAKLHHMKDKMTHHNQHDKQHVNQGVPPTTTTTTTTRKL